jgi:hypothetical protein
MPQESCRSSEPTDVKADDANSDSCYSVIDIDVDRMTSKGIPSTTAVEYVKQRRKQARHLLKQSDGSRRCAGCEMITGTAHVFHHNYKGLQVSATAGCPLCQVFLDSFQLVDIRGNPSSEITVNRETNKLYYKFYEFTEKVFELFTPRGDIQRFPKLISLAKQHLDLIGDDASDNPLREVQATSDSESCYSLARMWLNNCIETHFQCAQPDYVVPPTRLLDVTGVKVCLLHSSDIREKRPDYATLSYCWGGQMGLQTTKDTSANHQRGITTSELPRTLLDAVTVTRQLGLKYLWVDALCILQDSTEDWERECSRIGDYYKYSYVTISALESPGAEEGFLKMRPAIRSTPLFTGSRTWIRKPLPGRKQIFKNAALCQRGWALQERLLATRILHYAKSELFWECLTCCAREGSAEQHKSLVDSCSLVESDGEDFKRSLFTLGNDPYSIEDGAFALWYRIVKRYTQRSLTRSSDKLPAISGVAAMVEKLTGSRYFAGIWEQDLHGLAWCRDEPGYTKSAKIPGRAPSWSWASVDGPITYRFYEEQRINSEKDAKLIESPHHRNSNLTLRALFKPAWYVLGWLYNGDKPFHSTLKEDYWEQNRPNIPYPYSSYRPNFPYDIFDAQGTFGIGSFDEYDPSIKKHQCAAIRICERAYEMERREYSFWDPAPAHIPRLQTAVYFLLVTPDNETEASWKRIGMGITRSGTGHPWTEHSNIFDECEWKDIQLV